MTPVIHQNCAVCAAGKRGQRHVHAEEAGDDREWAKDDRDAGQHFRNQRQLIRHRGQMRIENAGHPILKDDGVVGESDQLIVDVAEPVGVLLVDEVELAAREPGDDVALGNDDAAHRAKCRA